MHLYIQIPLSENPRSAPDFNLDKLENIFHLCMYTVCTYVAIQLQLFEQTCVVATNAGC